jgi:hypothetical protein
VTPYVAAEILVHLVERDGVLPALQRQRFHGAEHHLDVLRLGGGDHLLEVRPDYRNGDAAQAVVDAKLEDKDLRMLRERCVEPTQRPGGRVT